MKVRCCRAGARYLPCWSPWRVQLYPHVSRMLTRAVTQARACRAGALAAGFTAPQFAAGSHASGTCRSPGVLHILGMPIGNAHDVAASTLQVLPKLSLVAVEDTRVYRGWLKAWGMPIPAGQKVVSCPEHQVAARTPAVLAALGDGRQVGLASDAGLPGIADPGARIVAAVHDAGYGVRVHGAGSAVAAAVCVAGVQAAAHHGWTFHAWVPKRSAEKLAWSTELCHPSQGSAVHIAYESPARLEHTLDLLADAELASGQARSMCIAVNLTKPTQRIIRHTSIAAVRAAVREQPVQGEIVLVMW